jgi:hypothetical protein
MRRLHLAALTAALTLAAAACAAPADEDASASAGANAANGPQSINGKAVHCALVPLDTGTAMHAYAAVSEGATPDEIEVVASSFFLSPRAPKIAFTARGEAAPKKGAWPSGVPTNAVTGGTPRLGVFGPSGWMTDEASPRRLNMFERVELDGDTLRYTSTLSDGSKVKGSFALPGRATGKAHYEIAVIPREVPAGSIFGTHFFVLDAECPGGGACFTDAPFPPPPAL